MIKLNVKLNKKKSKKTEEVANIWKNINWGSVEKVVYAVPGDNENVKVFRRIFK